MLILVVSVADVIVLEMRHKPIPLSSSQNVVTCSKLCCYVFVMLWAFCNHRQIHAHHETVVYNPGHYTVERFLYHVMRF